MKVAVVTDDVANENPANQRTQWKYNDSRHKVASHLVCQLLYRCLDINTTQSSHLPHSLQHWNNYRNSETAGRDETAWVRDNGLDCRAAATQQQYQLIQVHTDSQWCTMSEKHQQNSNNIINRSLSYRHDA